MEGEKWFFDTLVDADSAINAMMWQNAGRSGIDQVLGTYQKLFSFSTRFSVYDPALSLLLLIVKVEIA